MILNSEAVLNMQTKIKLQLDLKYSFLTKSKEKLFEENLQIEWTLEHTLIIVGKLLADVQWRAFYIHFFKLKIKLK